MINQFWNLCRACPSMNIDKLHSEYRSTYRWYEYTPQTTNDVISKPPKTQGALPLGQEPQRLPSEEKEHRVRMSQSEERGRRRRFLQPSCRSRSEGPIGKADNDQFFIGTEYKTQFSWASKRRARPEHDPLLPTRKPSSNIPKLQPTLVNGVVPDGGPHHKAISKNNLQDDTAPGQPGTPRKSKSMGRILHEAPESTVSHKIAQEPVRHIRGHRRAPSDGVAWRKSKEEEKTQEEKGKMDEMEEKQYKKSYQSEYRKKFRPFSQYQYVDGRFHKSKTEDCTDSTNAWYKEVLELRRQAGQYRARHATGDVWRTIQCRGWGVETASEHLNELYTKQAELWDQVSRRSSLQALSLAATAPCFRPISKAEKDLENSRRSSPIKHIARERPSTAPPKHRPTAVHQKSTEKTDGKSSKETTPRHQQDKPSTGANADVITTPPKPRGSNLLNKGMTAKRPVRSAPPDINSSKATSQLKRSSRATSAKPPTARETKSKEGRSISVGPENRSPKRTPRLPPPSHNQAPSAKPERRPRPTSLSTSVRRKGADSTVPQRHDEQKKVVKKSHDSPKTGEEKKVDKKLKDEEFDAKKDKEKELTREGITKDSVEALKDTTGGRKSTPEPRFDPEKYEPVVKTPPEPTRVKSPDQVGKWSMVKSPDPVNWTVPLDTGKTFTVTHNIPEGESSRATPSEYRSHSLESRPRQTPEPTKVYQGSLAGTPITTASAVGIGASPLISSAESKQAKPEPEKPSLPSSVVSSSVSNTSSMPSKSQPSASNQSDNPSELSKTDTKPSSTKIAHDSPLAQPVVVDKESSSSPAPSSGISDFENCSSSSVHDINSSPDFSAHHNSRSSSVLSNDFEHENLLFRESDIKHVTDVYSTNEYFNEYTEMHDSGIYNKSDELCSSEVSSPILTINDYNLKTCDKSILKDEEIQFGIIGNLSDSDVIKETDNNNLTIETLLNENFECNVKEHTLENTAITNDTSLIYDYGVADNDSFQDEFKNEALQTDNVSHIYHGSVEDHLMENNENLGNFPYVVTKEKDDKIINVVFNNCCDSINDSATDDNIGISLSKTTSISCDIYNAFEENNEHFQEGKNNLAEDAVFTSDESGIDCFQSIARDKNDIESDTISIANREEKETSDKVKFRNEVDITLPDISQNVSKTFEYNFINAETQNLVNDSPIANNFLPSAAMNSVTQKNKLNEYVDTSVALLSVECMEMLESNGTFSEGIYEEDNKIKDKSIMESVASEFANENDLYCTVETPDEVFQPFNDSLPETVVQPLNTEDNFVDNAPLTRDKNSIINNDLPNEDFCVLSSDGYLRSVPTCVIDNDLPTNNISEQEIMCLNQFDYNNEEKSFGNTSELQVSENGNLYLEENLVKENEKEDILYTDTSYKKIPQFNSSDYCIPSKENYVQTPCTLVLPDEYEEPSRKEDKLYQENSTEQIEIKFSEDVAEAIGNTNSEFILSEEMQQYSKLNYNYLNQEHYKNSNENVNIKLPCDAQEAELRENSITSCTKLINEVINEQNEDFNLTDTHTEQSDEHYSCIIDDKHQIESNALKIEKNDLSQNNTITSSNQELPELSSIGNTIDENMENYLQPGLVTELHEINKALDANSENISEDTDYSAVLELNAKEPYQFLNNTINADQNVASLSELEQLNNQPATECIQSNEDHKMSYLLSNLSDELNINSSRLNELAVDNESLLNDENNKTTEHNGDNIFIERSLAASLEEASKIADVYETNLCHETIEEGPLAPVSTELLSSQSYVLQHNHYLEDQHDDAVVQFKNNLQNSSNTDLNSLALALAEKQMDEYSDMKRQSDNDCDHATQEGIWLVENCKRFENTKHVDLSNSPDVDERNELLQENSYFDTNSKNVSLTPETSNFAEQHKEHFLTTEFFRVEENDEQLHTFESMPTDENIAAFIGSKIFGNDKEFHNVTHCNNSDDSFISSCVLSDDIPTSPKNKQNLERVKLHDDSENVLVDSEELPNKCKHINEEDKTDDDLSNACIDTCESQDFLYNVNNCSLISCEKVHMEDENIHGTLNYENINEININLHNFDEPKEHTDETVCTDYGNSEQYIKEINYCNVIDAKFEQTEDCFASDQFNPLIDDKKTVENNFHGEKTLTSMESLANDCYANIVVGNCLEDSAVQDIPTEFFNRKEEKTLLRETSKETKNLSADDIESQTLEDTTIVNSENVENSDLFKSSNAIFEKEYFYVHPSNDAEIKTSDNNVYGESSISNINQCLNDSIQVYCAASGKQNNLILNNEITEDINEEGIEKETYSNYPINLEETDIIDSNKISKCNKNINEEDVLVNEKFFNSDINAENCANNDETSRDMANSEFENRDDDISSNDASTSYFISDCENEMFLNNEDLSNVLYLNDNNEESLFSFASSGYSVAYRGDAIDNENVEKKPQSDTSENITESSISYASNICDSSIDADILSKKEEYSEDFLTCLENEQDKLNTTIVDELNDKKKSDEKFDIYTTKDCRLNSETFFGNEGHIDILCNTAEEKDSLFFSKNTYLNCAEGVALNVAEQTISSNDFLYSNNRNIFTVETSKENIFSGFSDAVYTDRNENGKIDKSEKQIENADFDNKIRYYCTDNTNHSKESSDSEVNEFFAISKVNHQPQDYVISNFYEKVGSMNHNENNDGVGYGMFLHKLDHVVEKLERQKKIKVLDNFSKLEETQQMVLENLEVTEDTIVKSNPSDPMTMSMYGTINGINGKTSGSPSPTKADVSILNSSENKCKDDKSVSAKDVGLRNVPGTNLRCLDDPSFMFDKPATKSNNTNSKIAFPEPKISESNADSSEKKHASKENETPLDSKAVPAGYRILEAPVTKCESKDPSELLHSKITDSSMKTAPYRVLEGSNDTSGKQKSAPYHVLEAPDTSAYYSQSFESGNSSKDSKPPALVSPSSGRTVTDALDKARNRFDSFWGGAKEKEPPSQV